MSEFWECIHCFLGVMSSRSILRIPRPRVRLNLKNLLLSHKSSSDVTQCIKETHPRLHSGWKKCCLCNCPCSSTIIVTSLLRSHSFKVRRSRYQEWRPVRFMQTTRQTTIVVRTRSVSSSSKVALHEYLSFYVETDALQIFYQKTICY